MKSYLIEKVINFGKRKFNLYSFKINYFSVCYQQILIYDDFGRLTEIDFLLLSVELTKLAFILERTF